MSQGPNILFILVDQVRAGSLPAWGETQIETPHLQRLAGESVLLDNMIATAPVCTPYRAMLTTGRHPQTTGHIMNFVNTRHDEIGLGDVFARNGWRTAWVGKWHLHRGSFPEIDGGDYVPEGRDRLGFEHWRGYNFHTDYFGGKVNTEDWHNERWEGYETDALARYAIEFMEGLAADERFCLFVSPHQAHYTPYRYAPEEYYARLPEELTLPDNVPPEMVDGLQGSLRDYLAMILTIDDMVGDLMAYLERSGRAQDTLVIFTSDHGTQMGSQGGHAWEKKQPWEESLRVPWMMRWPGVFEGGVRRDALTAPVDIFPTLCGLCDLPVPRTVEGYNLADAWRGRPGAFEQEALLTMNFSASHDWLLDGHDWRGVRTKTHSFARRLAADDELYDLAADPLQLNNLAGQQAVAGVQAELEAQLDTFLALRNDSFRPCQEYSDWFDSQRRVVRNMYGPLGDPEDEPDWSLLW